MISFKDIFFSAIMIYCSASAHETSGYGSSDIMGGPIGGQQDNDGCLIGAGYSWCDETQNCIRHWETPCGDNYESCDDCLEKQRDGINIACPMNCVSVRNTEDCSKRNYIWCSVQQRCLDPSKETCFSNIIMEPRVSSPLPSPPPISVSASSSPPKTKNPSLGSEPPMYSRPTDPMLTCPIPYEDCDSEYVCPKITEVTHCSEGGIDGYTTYQLSLIVKNDNINNIYAIFGSSEPGDHPMIFPPAYQTEGVFGSNIGGINPIYPAYNPESMYDSWLTIGITNGDPENKLATIGIDIYLWDEDTGIETRNGAIFLMDPEEKIIGGDEYIIAQITIPTGTTEEVIVNTQGKVKVPIHEETWTEYDIHFSISPPTPVLPNQIPSDCTLWYDGCNTCSVSDGILGGCTRMMCFREDNPHCLRYSDSDPGTGH